VDRSRFVSLIVAVSYFIVAIYQMSELHIFRFSLLLLLALTCIWFGDELGGYRGFARIGFVTKQTPGVIFRVFGWLIFALIALFWIFVKIT
jgi:hypothetical protein